MYQQKKSTTPSRHPERASYDEAEVHATLDEALIAHLGFVLDGRPQVLPLLFVRVGPTVYLHSSTGAQPARTAARTGEIEVCLEVTLLDGLVLARSAFSHSANYRSVVAHGTAKIVAEPADKEAVLVKLMDKLVPGRSSDARMPTETELRQTAVLALSLDEVGAKVRSGDPSDSAEDLGLPTWAGVWPAAVAWGAPRPSADLAAGIHLPGYLAGSRETGAGTAARRGGGVPA